MNAKEAREKAKQSNVANGSQYSEIIKLISEASTKGEYSMFYYHSINADVRQKLTEDGYEVGKTGFDRNESLTQIKW